MRGSGSCGRRSNDHVREIRHGRLPRRPRRRPPLRRPVLLQALPPGARGGRARRACPAAEGGLMGELAVILVWPALAGYVEAAVAYVGDGVRPGRLSRFAIWGVRIGWLAQTALLVVQAARAEGFPWGTWAGSLNLFVWLVVSAYLIWGCRAPFRLLGLVVMPLAAALFTVAWLSGGAGDKGRSELGDIFLAFHVGL